MKKKMISLLIVFLMCSFSNVSARIVTCHYQQELASSQPGFYVECQVYGKYSVQCMLTLTTEKEFVDEKNGLSILGTPYEVNVENWSKNFANVSWKGKDYVESMNECPMYVGIYYIDKNVQPNASNKNIWMAPDTVTFDSIKQNQYVGPGATIYKIPLIKTEKPEYGNTPMSGVNVSQSDCNSIFKGEFGQLLKDIYSLLKFAVPIIILVFAIIDFLKAISASDPNEVKKAANKLVKRMVIGVAIFVLPNLLEFVLASAGVNFGTCGIGSG